MIQSPAINAMAHGSRASTLLDYNDYNLCDECAKPPRQARNGLKSVEKRQELPLAAQQPASAVANASFMIRRMVRAQRPHCALQPRQP
jgi:hypothetical protein